MTYFRDERAFPGPMQAESDVGIHEGLRLEDYFAAKAMQAMVSSNWFSEGRVEVQEIVEQSYEIAAAMMCWRNS